MLLLAVGDSVKRVTDIVHDVQQLVHSLTPPPLKTHRWGRLSVVSLCCRFQMVTWTGRSRGKDPEPGEPPGGPAATSGSGPGRGLTVGRGPGVRCCASPAWCALQSWERG